MSEIEPHEVLMDKLAKEKEAEISERKIESPILEKPFLFFFILIIFCFSLFLLRVGTFQFLEGRKLSVLAEENRFSFLKIGAERGVIYDSQREQLTFNHLSFDVYFKKNERRNEKAIEILSKILEIDKKDLIQKIDKEREKEVLIARNLSSEKIIAILGQKENLPDVVLRENLLREYKEGETFSHLLGYLGRINREEFEREKDYYTIFDLVGRDGLEKFYEKTLRKKPGEIVVEKDAKGNKISVKVISSPEPGKNLILYLDAKLQRKIKEEMEKKIKEVGAFEGAAIAVDPQTGGVLSLISFPTFDNNLFSLNASTKKIEELFKDPHQPLFNRATAGQFPLGSTVKPLIALAALEEKIISENTTINCEGKIEIPHTYDPEKVYIFRDWAVHGKTNVKKAVAESCNVFFYTIGGGYKDQKGLGPTKIREYLEKFGLGKIVDTDFPIPFFSQGLIGSPEWKKEKFGEHWWDGDTYNLSIGQGYILATPLQVAQAFLPIANGGKFYKIKFVKRIEDSYGKVIEEFKPEVWRENFISEKNLKIVREGMRMTVTGQGAPLASAKSLSQLPVVVAAKTGTAQISKKDCKNCYTVWIVAFAPFDHPKILLVLTIDGVKDISTAITIPVAREILNWYFASNTP
jgi:penicillin-binding protein 2